MNLDRKVRFGIIGADFSLRAYMAFASYPHDLAEFVALCDRNPEMLAKFRKEHPECASVRTCEDPRDLFAMPDVDAVFIMVRDQYHKELAVAALEAGKAVYLEKPMALSIEDCDEILRTAMRTGSKLFLGHNMRYFPVIRKMKEIIDSGVIGQVQAVWCRHFVAYGSCYFRHWCSHQATCNSLLLQKGAHDIDVIHWLAGGYGRRVVGMGRLSVYNRNTGRRLAPGETPDRHASFHDGCWPPLEIDGLVADPDVEDHNMILFELDNGVQCSYEHCMYAPNGERNYTFIGDKGRIENIGDAGDCHIHVWTSRGPRTAPDIDYLVKPVEGTHGGSDPQILRAFFEYVAHGVRPDISPIAARNAVAVGCMGQYSVRHGSQPMDVPPPAPELVRFFEEH